MKRFFSLVLATIIATLTLSCASKHPDSLGDTTESESIQYVIYCSSMDIERQSTANTEMLPDNVEFKDSSQMDFALAQRTEVSSKQVPTKKTITMNGINYTLPLSCSYATSLANCENAELKACGLVDQYWTSDGMVAEYRQGSGELLFYSELGATSSDGQLSLNDATEIASELLVSLYESDVVEQYTHISTTDSADGFIYVNYVRYVQGYATADTIQIKLKQNGAVKMINALKMGIFNPIEDEITAAKIQSAETALRASVSEKWTLDEDTERLVIGSDGKCYLEVLGVCDSTEDEALDTSMEKFYINID